MLTDELPRHQPSLTVAPKNVQIVIAEENGKPLALVLPPIEVLLEIEALRDSHISLQEVSIGHAEMLEQAFRMELDSMKEKLQRFSASPTFLNRMANLAAATGDLDEEARFLELAKESSEDDFFLHRIGSNLFARGHEREAEALFASLDLDNDLHANLMLAMSHVRRQDLAQAETRINKALEIDPISFAARLFAGGLALVKCNFEHAIQSFRIASEERPTSAAIYSNMAVAYVGIERHDKAMSALKRAVALDPLNVHIVSLLADLANHLLLDEEAVPSLRYFLQFEQTLPEVWGRLARACLKIRKYDEAIAALKKQASLEDGSAVWNNLGVAYVHQRDSIRALQCFNHAIKLERADRTKSYFLAARNRAQLLADRFLIDDLLQVSTATIAEDSSGLCRKDDILSDVYAFYLYALRTRRDFGTYRRIARELLAAGDTSQHLKIWIVGSLVAYLALYERDTRNALQLISDCQSWIEHLPPPYQGRRAVLFNNLAFALADFGQVAEAEKYLRRILNLIHKAPFPTATLGLLQIRRGHMDKGLERYEEALGLAIRREDKITIRQKLNLELAQHLMEINVAKARRLLTKVVDAQNGEDALARQAQQLLAALPSKDP